MESACGVSTSWRLCALGAVSAASPSLRDMNYDNERASGARCPVVRLRSRVTFGELLTNPTALNCEQTRAPVKSVGVAV